MNTTPQFRTRDELAHLETGFRGIAIGAKYGFKAGFFFGVLTALVVVTIALMIIAVF